MKTPLLSIIIPVYDADKTIGNVVSHILEQPMTDLELILINDGSHDNTLPVLKKFAKQDKRVRVFSHPNQGQSFTRNVGITRSKGKYLMFLDADDDINPTMINKMVEKITKEKVDLVTCGVLFNYIRNNKVISQTKMMPEPELARQQHDASAPYIVRLLGTNGLLYNLWTKIYRADLIRRHNLSFEVGLNFGEDLTFNLHYLKKAKKISFIDESLYIYDFNLAENTSGKSSLIYENRIKNYQEVIAFAGKNPSTELSDHLGWIKYYWFYSFVLALCASPLTKKERIKRLRDALQSDKLSNPGSKQHIGKKKRSMESLFYKLRRHPRTIYSLVSTINFCKNNQIFATAWRKFASKLLH